MKLWFLLSLLFVAGCNQGTETTKNPNATQIAQTDSPVRFTKQRPAIVNGPFGIAIGQSIESIGKTSKLDKPGLYIVDAPPKPSSAFETVVIVAFPETGVCQIRGVSADFENDSAGLRARGAVDELAEAMATKYGPAKKTDACYGSDSLCQSNYWMMTLSDNQRFYGYAFNGRDGVYRDTHISSVDLNLQGKNLNTSYILLEYKGDNTVACERAMKKAKADAL